MIYKCKICGGQISIDSQNGIAICDYCGTKQALPLFTEDSARLLYERGNNYLFQSEYDKAESMFSQLLTIMPNDPELYWDLVLCKYGVTYVNDPKTGKYIPTCNRTHYTPIFSDENYKKAIELSSEEKKALYKSDAETIDKIQKGIIAVSKKEKPFDIFISYKETDGNGNRTIDSVEAQNLYEKLTEAGYKVFFSRITLEDKVGAEYEPYIYAALYSSKVMLTVCSSRENIEAVWVKNEWSRFLQLRQNDADKTLLPLYFDMQKNELPDEFALLSSYNIKKDDFEQELLRGIKKLIPLPIMKAKNHKKRVKILSGLLAATCVLGGIGAVVALANNKASNDYNSAMKLFEEAKYETAADIFVKLKDYKNSAEMAKKCAIQPKYDEAMQFYYEGKYAEATWAFDELGDYEDAPVQKEKAELSWRKSVATVAIDTENLNGATNGAYYINTNGNVENLSYSPGTLFQEAKANKHGGIVSLGSDAMYEDGYLVINNTVDKLEIDDAIQIVGGITSPIGILKADGTVIVNDYECFAEISNWTKITKLYTIPICDGTDAHTIIGLDCYGNIHIAGDVCYGGHEQEISFLHTLKNIKELSVYFGENYTHIYAIDSDGIFHTALFPNDDNNTTPTIKAYKNSNIKKLIVVVRKYLEGWYYINEKDQLINLENNNLILSNVAYICDAYAVTKSGNLYVCGETWRDLGVKVTVQNEWLVN